LHLRALDILKALDTYHKPYLAAFRYLARERLPRISAETLLLSSRSDAPLLRESAAELVTVLQQGRLVESSGHVADKAAAIVKFLRS
jgi:hypothetical protein